MFNLNEDEGLLLHPDLIRFSPGFKPLLLPDLLSSTMGNALQSWDSPDRLSSHMFHYILGKDVECSHCDHHFSVTHYVSHLIDGYCSKANHGGNTAAGTGNGMVGDISQVGEPGGSCMGARALITNASIAEV